MPRPMRRSPPTAGQMNAQSQSDFAKNWDRQVGCANQYDAVTSDAIFKDMLASDPVAAKWGPGVRRAPNVTSWGFNQAAAAKLQTPYAMVTGEHDKQVSPRTRSHPLRRPRLQRQSSRRPRLLIA